MSTDDERAKLDAAFNANRKRWSELAEYLHEAAEDSTPQVMRQKAEVHDELAGIARSTRDLNEQLRRLHSGSPLLWAAVGDSIRAYEELADSQEQAADHCRARARENGGVEVNQ